MEYRACHSICCDWTYDWVSRLVTFGHMLDYLSSQLVCLLGSTKLVPFLLIDIIRFSPETWLNWVWFLIPYYFKLFRLQCYSLHLLFGIWWKTLPITFWRILLFRPRPRAKYIRTLYPYIPRGLITLTCFLYL